MTENDQKISEDIARLFKDAGWTGAQTQALAGDASSRSYKRVEKDGRKAVLMIAPPDAETTPCPPGASEEERRSLGYNASARLAGPNLNAFTNIADALRAAGLSAPEIYAANERAGLALIEDLGDDLFARVVNAADEETLYAHAVDVLVNINAHPPARPAAPQYEMLDYDNLALSAEADLLMEWYWPLKNGGAANNDLGKEYQGIMSDLLSSLSAPHTMVLRDFHAENLLWLPDRAGPARVGLIDFQDGLFGHGAYDLASLLEDARRDVSPDLARAMIERYIAQANNAVPNFDKEAFLNDYAVLAAQRNAKILGVFARLAKRDNKPRYLDLLPRVEAHFRRDLARSQLGPLRKFVATHFPGLAS